VPPPLPPPQPATNETAATSQPAEQNRILNFSLNQIDGALRSTKYNSARGKDPIPCAEFTAFNLSVRLAPEA